MMPVGCACCHGGGQDVQSAPAACATPERLRDMQHSRSETWPALNQACFLSRQRPQRVTAAPSRCAAATAPTIWAACSPVTQWVAAKARRAQSPSSMGRSAEWGASGRSSARRRASSAAVCPSLPGPVLSVLLCRTAACSDGWRCMCREQGRGPRLLCAAQGRCTGQAESAQ